MINKSLHFNKYQIIYIANLSIELINIWRKSYSTYYYDWYCIYVSYKKYLDVFGKQYAMVYQAHWFTWETPMG